MGPISRAAMVKRQITDSEFQGAVLEELQGIRAALNTLSGRIALDTETLTERIETLDQRITDAQRAPT